jgi:hypothetical protein
MTTIPINSISFDLVQTFFADKLAVANATEISFTSVELYFKNKPSSIKNASGIKEPKATIWLCEVYNGNPQPARQIEGSLVVLDYGSVFALADSSAATKFTFAAPVRVPTDKMYGICVKFDDNGYQVWTNKIGDRIAGTNTPSPGITTVTDGTLYLGPGTSSAVASATLSSTSAQTTSMTPKTDQDLKYRINVAKYTENTTTSTLFNKEYEFLTVSKTSAGVFKGGEFVFKNVANTAGTVKLVAGNTTVIGTGTSFDTFNIAGKTIVIYNSAASKFEVFEVGTYRSATEITLTRPPTFSGVGINFKVTPTARVYKSRTLQNNLVLVDSTAANSGFKFTAADSIIGSESQAQYSITSVDPINLDRFNLKAKIAATSRDSVVLRSAFTYLNSGTYTIDDLKIVVNGQARDAVTKSFKILSRSMEVLESTLYGTEKKSSYHTVTMTKPAASLYTAPVVDTDQIDIEITKRLISANAYQYVTTGGVIYDQEVQGNSANAAISKYISKKIPFANNRFSEDVKVFLTAYRPEGTDVKVYCRVHNSSDPDAFESKAWTPLTCSGNIGQFSALNNKNSLVEYTYELPAYSETANTIPGNFTTQSSNNVIVAATGTNPSTYVVANDAIKIYNPLVPTNYQVAIVTAANSSSITIGELVTNTNIIGVGFHVDKLKYPNIAFNNPLNDNISRYYNNTFAEFDKYDTMQLKIVLTAENTNITPEVTQYQFIGVSA